MPEDSRVEEVAGLRLHQQEVELQREIENCLEPYRVEERRQYGREYAAYVFYSGPLPADPGEKWAARLRHKIDQISKGEWRSRGALDPISGRLPQQRHILDGSPSISSGPSSSATLPLPGPGRAQHGASGSSGSWAFDQIRGRLQSEPELKQEVEWALQRLVERVNPSERGLRFTIGAAVEWIMTALACRAGVLVAPAGHGADGYDLAALMEEHSLQWSVKSSFSGKASHFTLTNGQGGAGKGFVKDTLFLAPQLPGIVFASPTLHPKLASKVQAKSDATTISLAAVKEHAANYPSCVAHLAMPKNKGLGKEDPALIFIKGLLEIGSFSRLGEVFHSKPRSEGLTPVEELAKIGELVRAGALDPALAADLERDVRERLAGKGA